jgi:hypothetical protein
MSQTYALKFSELKVEKPVEAEDELPEHSSRSPKSSTSQLVVQEVQVQEHPVASTAVEQLEDPQEWKAPAVEQAIFELDTPFPQEL